MHCTVPYCTALSCTALHCTALYCTLMYCNTLHCTALSWLSSPQFCSGCTDCPVIVLCYCPQLTVSVYSIVLPSLWLHCIFYVISCVFLDVCISDCPIIYVYIIFCYASERGFLIVLFVLFIILIAVFIVFCLFLYSVNIPMFPLIIYFLYILILCSEP